jgi:hypothetical protein
MKDNDQRQEDARNNWVQHMTVSAKPDDLINEIRRRNLRRLIEEYGGARILAKRLNVSESRLSHIMTRARTWGERSARAWEKKLGLNTGWFDTDFEKREARPSIDNALLAEVSAVVTTEIKGSSINEEKLVQLIALVFFHALKDGKVDRDLVQGLVRMAK